MSRLPDATFGRLSLEERTLVVACERPGLRTDQIADVFDEEPLRVRAALWGLRVRPLGTPPAVLRVGSTRDSRWFPTDAGRARMLETRATFEAAVANRETA